MITANDARKLTNTYSVAVEKMLEVLSSAITVAAKEGRAFLNPAAEVSIAFDLKCDRDGPMYSEFQRMLIDQLAQHDYVISVETLFYNSRTKAPEIVPPFIQISW